MRAPHAPSPDDARDDCDDRRGPRRPGCRAGPGLPRPPCSRCAGVRCGAAAARHAFPCGQGTQPAGSSAAPAYPLACPMPLAVVTGATGSPVPCQRLRRAHVTSTPGTARAARRPPPLWLRARQHGAPLSRELCALPVLMPSFRLSMRQQWFTRSFSRHAPDPLTAGLFLQRSPPRLLTGAACSGSGGSRAALTSRSAIPPHLLCPAPRGGALPAGGLRAGW
jgi:hypothetical protein